MKLLLLNYEVKKRFPCRSCGCSIPPYTLTTLCGTCETQISLVLKPFIWKLITYNSTHFKTLILYPYQIRDILFDIRFSRCLTCESDTQTLEGEIYEKALSATCLSLEIQNSLRKKRLYENVTYMMLVSDGSYTIYLPECNTGHRIHL